MQSCCRASWSLLRKLARLLTSWVWCMQWLDYHKAIGVGRVYVIDHLSEVSILLAPIPWHSNLVLCLPCFPPPAPRLAHAVDLRHAATLTHIVGAADKLASNRPQVPLNKTLRGDIASGYVSYEYSTMPGDPLDRHL